MSKNITRKLRIGDYLIPLKGATEKAPYVNVTTENIDFFNAEFKKDPKNLHYFLVVGDEIKIAEKYLQDLVGIRIGDYVKLSDSSIDRISEIPNIKNKVDVWSYSVSVKTERGGWLWGSAVPGARVTKGEAKAYFEQLKQSHENMVSVFESQINEAS